MGSGSAHKRSNEVANESIADLRYLLPRVHASILKWAHLKRAHTVSNCVVGCAQVHERGQTGERRRIRRRDTSVTRLLSFRPRVCNVNLLACATVAAVGFAVRPAVRPSRHPKLAAHELQARERNAKCRSGRGLRPVKQTLQRLKVHLDWRPSAHRRPRNAAHRSPRAHVACHL